jgi:hypothetical protein
LSREGEKEEEEEEGKAWEREIRHEKLIAFAWLN